MPLFFHMQSIREPEVKGIIGLRLLSVSAVERILQKMVGEGYSTMKIYINIYIYII